MSHDFQGLSGVVAQYFCILGDDFETVVGLDAKRWNATLSMKPS